MKRIMMLMAFILLTLYLSGCKGVSINTPTNGSLMNIFLPGSKAKVPTPAKGSRKVPSSEPKTVPKGATVHPSPSSSPPLEGFQIDFSYKRIRTNSTASLSGYPKAVMIFNTKELSDYYESVSHTFQMESFIKATAGYDNKWFESHMLIIAVLEENSGSIGHRITSILSNNNKLLINIVRDVPETGTCDMAQYHIFIEIPSSEYKGETPVINFINTL